MSTRRAILELRTAFIALKRVPLIEWPASSRLWETTKERCRRAGEACARSPHDAFEAVLERDCDHVAPQPPCENGARPMKIAILSDIHDNVWKLAAALEHVRGADALLCCGDLCSPFVVHQMARALPCPIHIVFGNNDGDPYRITANAQKYAHVRIHGEFFQGEFDGRRFAMVHYDNIAAPVVKSGAYDVVCYGHNHVYSISRSGITLAINPGALMGAAFAADGSRTDVASTFVIYDTATGEPNSLEVKAEAGGGFAVALFKKS